LVNQNTLEPFIAITDAEWLNELTSKIRAYHTGLIVYNLTTTPPFFKGLFVWDGSQWKPYMQTANNGLSQSNSHLQWGGQLVNDSTVISVDANSRKLKFNIENSVGSTDDKGMFIKGLNEQLIANSRAVTVDINTGKLGTAGVVPAQMAFFQSGAVSGNIAATITGGSRYVVPWSISDQVSNNLVTFDQANSCFITQSSGILEISAFVCYSPRHSASGHGVTNNTVCLLNATLQVAKVATPTTWTDYSSVRMVWVGLGSFFRQTLNIPPVLLTVSAGDRLRLVILRPPNNSGGGYLGDDHTFSSSGDPTGIAPAFGTNFSKSIKILAVQ
jgi:hypothetical protein